MRKLMVFPAAILCLAVVAAYAQSLGDLAREEQERRNSIPADKTIIIEVAPAAEPKEDVSTDVVGNKDDYDETENPKNTDGDEDGEESDYYDEEAAPKTAADSKAKTELYWRNAMADVQDRVKQLEEEGNDLATRRNALQLQRNKASGTRRGTIDDEINRLAFEQELNEKNLEQAREERRSLQNEARSSGALPGFVE